MVRLFGHYVPRSLLSLAIAETIILFLSMYLGVAVRFSSIDLSPESIDLVYPVFPKAIVFTAVVMSIMAALGLYQREIHEGGWGYYGRFTTSFVLGFAFLTTIFYVIPGLLLGRGALALAFLFAISGTAFARLVFLKFVDHNALKRQILVLGTSSRAAQVDKVEKLNQTRGRFRVVGYLPMSVDHHEVDESKILHDSGPLLSIVQRFGIDEIVVGIRDRRGGMPIQELLECKLEGITVSELSTFFERETGHVQLESVNPSWMVFSEGFRRSTLRDLIKRSFDIITSTILLLVTLPVMILVAVLIKLDSRGPVLYQQRRVGECGNTFMALKFRSMHVNAEQDGVPQWARTNDDRVTRVGSIVRKLRVDELPQIFNVLRGDMSFVGPRPERPFFVEQLSKEIPYYLCRHSVKPGITGWAQIRYPYGASIEDAREKLQYDLYYAKNHSLFLDLIILFQTAQVILFHKGAR